MMKPFCASLLGGALGVFANVLDQHAGGPLRPIGAGAALWLTATFLTAYLARSTVAAICAASVFLGCWLLGFYAANAYAQDVALSTMWPTDRPWFELLIPRCVALGVLATLAHRPGPLGDTALAVPLVWSLL